jgi:hypothetical protein
MTVPSVSSSSRALGAALAAALLLAGGAPAIAQTLTASANPPSGGAGVNNSYLTGSGFPTGPITSAAAHFARTCAAPALASAPIAQVAAAGTLRRFQFLIPASLAPGVYRVWVTGTAGTTAFDTLRTPSCSSLTVTSTIAGTASLGAALAGAAVTVVDSTGRSVSTTTASDGTFALSSAGLVPPFLVRVVTASATGSFPAGTTLYSVSADASASTRINVSVLTDLMVRSFYSAQGVNPADAFADPTGPNAAPTPTAVESLASLVVPAVQLWLDQAGIAATSGAPDNGSINLISSPLVAYPPGTVPAGGLDAVLHLIVSELVNPATGAVTQVTIAGGTLTETIAPSYADDLITLATTTIDAATGSGSSGLFSALALTAVLQPVIDGIDGALAAFRDTVNSRGDQLTGADLRPFYAPDYLENGVTADQAANEDAAELAGVTITALRLAGIKSLDTTTNVAAALVRFSASAGGQTVSEVGPPIFFKNVGGAWVLYGNQRVADVFVSAQARTAQGGASFGPGIFAGTFVFAGVSAPSGVVTSATVAGPVSNPNGPVDPTLRIWDNSTSGTLFRGAQELKGGRSFDQFFRLSQNLGNNAALLGQQIPPGSGFDFTLSTTTSGIQQFRETINAFTTETVTFTGLPAHLGLAAVVGQTVPFSFTLPGSYPVRGVSLFAQIFDGLPGNPATRFCTIDSNGLALDFAARTGTGSISVPSDMAACGLPPGTAIRFVNVFLEVEGANTEVSLGWLAIPY